MKKMVVGMLVALWVGGVAAQGNPTKPVRLIIPQAQGGSSDILGRSIAEALGARLGQNVVVENRVGAGGNIGTGEVVKILETPAMRDRLESLGAIAWPMGPEQLLATIKQDLALWGLIVKASGAKVD